MNKTENNQTAAQKLAEIMVRREAAKKKIVLPLKFWNTDPWKKKYKQQIIAANALLKIYEPAAIFNALKRKECSWQYSLRANGINDACKEEQALLEKKEVVIEEFNREFSTAVTTEIKKFGTESKRNKLRD